MDIGTERLSLRIEACQLDELLKRMSKEQAIVFIQGVRRRVEESLPGSTAATSLSPPTLPKKSGGLAMFFPSWAPNLVTEREIDNGTQEPRLHPYHYGLTTKKGKEALPTTSRKS